MTNLNILKIKDITDGDILFIKEHYPQRYRYASKYKNRNDFLQSIGAYIILNKMIGEFSEDDIYYNNGKPYIKNKPFFSIAHSNELVGVLISNKEIGFDLQYIDNTKLGRLTDLLTINEINDGKDAFLYWTRKEAVLKLTGIGISKVRDVKTLDTSKDIIYFNDSCIKITSKLENGYAFSFAQYIEE